MPAKTSDESVQPVAAEVPVRTFEQLKVEQEAVRLSLIDKMRDYFKDQKRVRVKVRNDQDVSVQINGYTFVVQKDVYVDVPVDVRDALEEAGYI